MCWPKGFSAVERIMSMKNSNDTIGNRTRDLAACSTVPQPTVPPCTSCYCVSTDIFPFLYISKQSLSLLTEFSYRCVSLWVYLPLKSCTATNVLFLPFIAYNSKHDAHSRVKNQGFTTDWHNLLCLSKTIISSREYLTGAIVMMHCIMHLCYAQFGQNKVLITAFSRVLNIQGVSKMLRQSSKVSNSYQNKEHSSYTRI